MFFSHLSAYIDPGTGSMLVTIVIGIAATLIYAMKGLFIKLKARLTGGRVQDVSSTKIPYVIYSDSKRYWNVFGPICDEFERRQIPLTYYTQSQDDPVFEQDYKYITAEFIGEGSKGFARLNILHAGTVLSTTPGLDVYQWKRSKNVDRYIHIFHDVTEATGYRMFGMDYYDDILLSGAFQGDYIRKLEELRGLPAKRLHVVGSTYLDGMKARAEAEGTGKSSAGNASAAVGVSRTVLLAPSWGVSSILNRFGADILNALIATGYDIIVRPHPQMKTSDPELLAELMRRFPDGEHFSWNFDNDNFDVLRRSDIMITDYSGIMFDYCLIFDRPLMYADTSFDKAPYDAAWIDGPVWHIDILKDLGKRLDPADFANMKACIDEVLESDVYRAGREKVRETVWQNEGKAAVETVDYMTEGTSGANADTQCAGESKDDDR